MLRYSIIIGRTATISAGLHERGPALRRATDVQRPSHLEPFAVVINAGVEARGFDLSLIFGVGFGNDVSHQRHRSSSDKA